MSAVSSEPPRASAAPQRAHARHDHGQRRPRGSGRVPAHPDGRCMAGGTLAATRPQRLAGRAHRRYPADSGADRDGWSDSVPPALPAPDPRGSPGAAPAAAASPAGPARRQAASPAGSPARRQPSSGRLAQLRAGPARPRPGLPGRPARPAPAAPARRQPPAARPRSRAAPAPPPRPPAPAAPAAGPPAGAGGGRPGCAARPPGRRPTWRPA